MDEVAESSQCSDTSLSARCGDDNGCPNVVEPEKVRENDMDEKLAHQYRIGCGTS